MNIVIYGRPNCQWCDAAKNLLDIKKIPYVYNDLNDIAVVNRQRVINDSGMKTLPIVKIDEIYIGGFDALDGYIRGKEIGV